MAETKVSDPIITFKNVSKTYTLYKDDKARFKALFFKPRNAKTNKALNNVSMVINRGESVGIVGDNGAGKSTTLNAIAGVWPVRALHFPTKAKSPLTARLPHCLSSLQAFPWK